MVKARMMISRGEGGGGIYGGKEKCVQNFSQKRRRALARGIGRRIEVWGYDVGAGFRYFCRALVNTAITCSGF
jgi:hypothetical protein